MLRVAMDNRTGDRLWLVNGAVDAGAPASIQRIT